MKHQQTQQKPKAVLYLNASGKNTEILMNHIAQHVDTLNRYLVIDFIYITASNTAAVKKHGITKSPAMIYAGKKYEGVGDILRVLSPAPPKEQHNIDDLSPDDILLYWQQKHSDPNDDSEDENDPDTRKREIQQKMAMIQKRRPVMVGVDNNHKLAGGRPITKSGAGKSYGDYGTQAGDSVFLQDSGRDEVVGAANDEQSNGELMLEDYYLAEAYQFGKKNTPNRRAR